MSGLFRKLEAITIRAISMLHVFYKYCISPLIGKVCRFEPSCSDFFMEALRVHGLIHGTWLGLKRISKCHAFNPGGYDPVPGVLNKK
ncbi:MAG: membrane protein insertion efficiency factor YidD [SAR324 cluster bacterium]|uniref:Putative membrane protein insertion efficiency factor n=1 Tax=SAR324 cluster bacterium TaxID=2024889 RepID=A0A7X9FT58_9DELT|nr:membrane protein insertion efficiency factor YidD [SAR324 cluster bacterium]